jgi:hypothetical protein
MYFNLFITTAYRQNKLASKQFGSIEDTVNKVNKVSFVFENKEIHGCRQ